MSSTYFNIGMGEGRNSSRVLKPPGGGHSQIFGFSKEEEVPKKNRQMSEINACFTQESCATKKTEETTTTKTQIIEESKQDENNTNGNNIEIETINGELNGKHERNTNKEIGFDTKTDSTPQRKRVPPGGYSSGFW